MTMHHLPSQGSESTAAGRYRRSELRLPVIGLTTARRIRGSSWDVEDLHSLARTYVSAIAQAGGCPVLIPPVPHEQIRTLLNRIDGLVLTGGEDISAEYGGTAQQLVDPIRDAFELELISAARMRRLPLLGICRGLQVIVVGFGGSVTDDIPVTDTHPLPRQTVEQPLRRHQVRVQPDSWLAQVIGTERRVNSRHHQAAERIPVGLRVTATAPDGIVEAVESTDPSWPVYAVQWHPEDVLSERAGSAELFAAFVNCCR